MVRLYALAVTAAAPFGVLMTCHVPSGFFVFPVVVQGGNCVPFMVLKSLKAAPRYLCAFARQSKLLPHGPRRFIQAGTTLLSCNLQFLDIINSEYQF